MNNKLTNLI